METIQLNGNYLVRAVKDPVSGQWSGDVIMLHAQTKAEATHLFDCPALDSRESLKEWAEHALKAMSEG
jgi:hypothetical protein